MFHVPAGRFVLALGILVIVMILTKVLIQGLGILQGVLTPLIFPISTPVLTWRSTSSCSTSSSS